MSDKTRTKTVTVDYVARVEGEAALSLHFRDDQLTDVQLKIFEPPRFFEALLRGRNYTEATDITSRICGICPVAYQMTAAQALEHLCEVTIPEPLQKLRRLLYCGEWIASHTLHLYLLHAPDFLGFANGVDMAKCFPKEVERGLALKKVGSDIMSLLGGRDIHPINVRVGGFYRVPPREEVGSLREKLVRAVEQAEETLYWVAGFSFPDVSFDYTFVALTHELEYPITGGLVGSNRGLSLKSESFGEAFEEKQVPYSNAHHCVMKGTGEYYQVGPLARFSLNRHRLPAALQEAARAVGLDDVVRNPYRSIIVRALEVWYACVEALRLVDDYVEPSDASVPVTPRAGIGCAITEAPRGLLYHRYALDEQGVIRDAVIVPPTSQNQGRIERDLWEMLQQKGMERDDEIRYLAEHLVRSYDPCISCATHFLSLTVERT